MITPTRKLAKISIPDDIAKNIDSELIYSSSSPSSVRHLQQLSNSRLQPKWNHGNENHSNRKTMIHSPKQRKKPATQMPAPFVSFQVENENCAVYVGNIPSDERSPCQICCKESCNEEEGDQNCACAIELKAFLRDRINAAFKVPIEDIGIRTCRLFSVVTNVYSNTAEFDNLNQGGQPNKRSDRRVHRAACVEFDNPTIAEHCLALKFTSFHFNGQSHNRSSLRMRRWTTQPPKAVENTKSLNPTVPWSPRQPPPPPRSKSMSPKISSKRQQLSPSPRLKPMSPTAVNRKQQQRRKQIPVFQELPRSPLVQASPGFIADFVVENADGTISPSPFSSIVHVSNIPSEATIEELREFFLGRMNKAFHGVTPPEIIRVGMRYYEGDAPSRIDACVEFQDSRVANRATLLRNRRWYAKDGELHHEDDDELNSNSNHSLNNNSNHSSNSNNSDERRRRNAMPVLEIELWDITKYDMTDFFFARTNFGTTFYEANANEIGVESDKKVPVKPTRMVSPLQPTMTVDEARECGFLVCTNPNKIPKCDHLFTIHPQAGEGMGEVTKAKLCHGYAFRGKVCRNIYKKRSGSNRKVCGPLCPFAHIDSFDQLKDPHDVLSLLYYVENNDEVEFSSGMGCTPQEYLLQQREEQLNYQTETNSTMNNTETNHFKNNNLTQSTEEILRELRATQEQLRRSELARQSLLQQQLLNNDEKDGVIFTLQNEVALLRNELQKANHQLQASALAAENGRRGYAFLQEKYQQDASREGKSGISTELLEAEIIKLREELKKSHSDNQALKQQHHEQQTTRGSPTSDGSWSDMNFLNTFLERSTPSLMQMMDSTPDDPPKLDLSHQPRLTDIPIDCDSSRRIPYKSVIDCNPIQSLRLGANASPTRAISEFESLTSEIEYLVSCYGNQVFVNKNTTDGSTAVTRFLKLPMTLCKGRDIDVALVISLSKDYPWNGIVQVQSDPRYSNNGGSDSKDQKLVSESISGLLNVCRWEAEACQGKPHVLMSIMKAAERWVTNDWKAIQKKKMLMDFDSEESHFSG